MSKYIAGNHEQATAVKGGDEPIQEGSVKGNTRQIAATSVRAEPPKPRKPNRE